MLDARTRARWTVAIGALVLSACGTSEEPAAPAVQLDDPDEPSIDEVGWPDAGAPLPATPRSPCASSNCWLNAPALTGACGSQTVKENFATGKYNVHRFTLSAPAGVGVDAMLEATGGSWNPALLVLAEDGTTLYDGQFGGGGGGVSVQALASGKSSSLARVRLEAQADTPLHLFVTSWAVVDGGFTPPMPGDAAYSLELAANCPLPSAKCPVDEASIIKFGSGYFTASESSDPSSANYSPYKRDSRTEHSGYDIYAPLGTPALATQSGTIVASKTTDTDLCGKSVNLTTDAGVTFRYCHLDSVVVTSGPVKAGDVIGEVGQTGNAKSPHIHFAYLDAPGVTGAGTAAQKSVKVNAYVDGLCQ